MVELKFNQIIKIEILYKNRQKPRIQNWEILHKVLKNCGYKTGVLHNGRNTL